MVELRENLPEVLKEVDRLPFLPWFTEILTSNVTSAALARYVHTCGRVQVYEVAAYSQPSYFLSAPVPV